MSNDDVWKDFLKKRELLTEKVPPNYIDALIYNVASSYNKDEFDKLLKDLGL